MPQESLFAPGYEQSLGNATNWWDLAFFGPLATILCVIAVALLGFRMLSGYFQFTDAIRILVGIVIVFGSPALAASLMLKGNEEATFRPPLLQAVEAKGRDLTPSESSPYSRASLRRD